MYLRGRTTGAGVESMLHPTKDYKLHNNIKSMYNLRCGRIQEMHNAYFRKCFCDMRSNNIEHRTL